MIVRFSYWTSHCGESFLALTAEGFNLGEHRSGVEEEVSEEERPAYEGAGE